MDRLHELLRGQVEVWTRSYLWVPGDTPNFKPALCDKIFGDGRALFTLSTLNSRPHYYVIRCDSGWASGLDLARGRDDDFSDHVDEILDALEDQFGSGRCGYSGASLYLRPKDRDCNCEECEDEYIAKWPVLDDEGGYSWGRTNWPFGFPTTPDPRCAWAGLLRPDCRV